MTQNLPRKRQFAFDDTNSNSYPMLPPKRARRNMATPALKPEEIQALQKAAAVLKQHDLESLHNTLDRYHETSASQVTGVDIHQPYLSPLESHLASGAINTIDQYKYHERPHITMQLQFQSSTTMDQALSQIPMNQLPSFSEEVLLPEDLLPGTTPPSSACISMNWLAPAPAFNGQITPTVHPNMDKQAIQPKNQFYHGASDALHVDNLIDMAWQQTSLPDDNSNGDLVFVPNSDILDPALNSSSDCLTDTSGYELNFDNTMWLDNPSSNEVASSLKSCGSGSTRSVPRDTSLDISDTANVQGRPADFTWVPEADELKSVIKSKQRRSKFTDQRLRQETSETRKNKACVRCRMQKVRCLPNGDNPNGICMTCEAVSLQKVYHLPCVRFKISECVLYRIGKAPGLEFTFRWPVMKLRDISEWANGDIRYIQVMSDVCPTPLNLKVRRFVPHPRDSLKKGWMDGKVKKFKETTPFAIVSMKAAVNDMHDYIDTNIYKSMDLLIFSANCIDKLVSETFNFACQHQRRHSDDEEGVFMANLLRLWFAIRRTATTEHIIGKDTLDMKPETIDRSYPLFGKVPMPPLMIQQLDMILTLGSLDPLRKKVLDDLQRLVISNKPKTWLTIYLAVFLLLHSCATLTAENYRNGRKHGLKRRYSMPAFISELHYGAGVLLAHYHYRTQPCDPFRMDWKRRQATPFADMTTTEIHFLRRTSELVKEKENEFRFNIEQELYEDDLYFIGQMFEPDWSPRDTKIDFDDGTIGDVPLRQLYRPSK